MAKSNYYPIPAVNFQRAGYDYVYDGDPRIYAAAGGPPNPPYNPPNPPHNPPDGIKNWFSKYRGALKNFHPFENLAKNGYIGDPELLGWTKNNGINLLGGKVGNLATGANVLYQGFNAMNNLNDLNTALRDTGDIKTDILASSASNPLTSQYLTSDEIKLLNQLKRGNLSTDARFGDNIGEMGLSALKGGALGLVTGGVPGAIVGALGSGLNKGITGQTQNQQQQSAKLEALLASLKDAEAQYKSMRRPNFTGLGIQSRFQNMYM